MSTHYTAGGMPLAFTQEDFLVIEYDIDLFEDFLSKCHLSFF